MLPGETEMNLFARLRLWLARRFRPEPSLLARHLQLFNSTRRYYL
jgi:hypothetical protein